MNRGYPRFFTVSFSASYYTLSSVRDILRRCDLVFSTMVEHQQEILKALNTTMDFNHMRDDEGKTIPPREIVNLPVTKGWED